MKTFKTKKECEEYIVAEYGSLSLEMGVIIPVLIGPTAARVIGCEPGYASSADNE